MPAKVCNVDLASVRVSTLLPLFCLIQNAFGQVRYLLVSHTSKLWVDFCQMFAKTRLYVASCGCYILVNNSRELELWCLQLTHSSGIFFWEDARLDVYGFGNVWLDYNTVGSTGLPCDGPRLAHLVRQANFCCSKKRDLQILLLILL